MTKYCVEGPMMSMILKEERKNLWWAGNTDLRKIAESIPGWSNPHPPQ
jgi:hypothetical protein